MTRQEKIELIENIKAGKVSVQVLKKRQPYNFERIGETNTYKDKFSGVVLTIEEINALPKFPNDLGRVDFIETGASYPNSILIMTDTFFSLQNE